MNLTILIFLLIPFSVNSHFYHNQPLSNSSGIFYLTKGTAKISATQLTLMTHLNATILLHTKRILNNYLRETQNICSTLSKTLSFSSHANPHCERTLELITREITDIEKKNEILDQLIESPLTRRKRAIIDVASYPLKWMFGIPDANDAQYYIDNINLLLKDNEQTNLILKSHVQIISNTIKNFRNSISSLEKYEESMNTNIDQINLFINQTNSQLTQLSLNNLLMQRFMTLLALTEHINNQYSLYIESINLAQNNIISPFVVTPEIIYDELTKYKNEYQFHIKPELRNIRAFYKIMKIQVITKNNMIIFVLKFPLVRDTNYKLYELIPLPIPHQNNSLFSYITPKTNYLLYSETQFSYLHELSDCIEYTNSQYLCQNIHTIQTTDQPTCEVELLNPFIKKIPSDCTTKITAIDSEIWRYIPVNQWIYVVQHPTTITIICSDSQSYMDDVTIHQTGILQLKETCKGYTNSFVLETTDDSKANSSYYIPIISITNDDCCTTSTLPDKLKTKLIRPIHLLNMDFSNLKYANKKLNETEKIILHRLTEPFIINNNNWISTIFAAIGTTLFIIFIIIISCKCCRYPYWIRRLFRFNTNNQPTTPLINNYVNFNFESDVHTDIVKTSDIVPYVTANRNPVRASSTSLITNESEAEDHSHAIQLRPRNRSHRSSTTPI